MGADRAIGVGGGMVHGLARNSQIDCRQESVFQQYKNLFRTGGIFSHSKIGREKF
jgi:hypothetical protein